MSVLFMNGTKDPLSPYDGGRIWKDKFERGEVLSTPVSVDYWVKHDATSHTAMVKEFANISRRDSSRVVRKSYRNGKQNTEVVLYKVIGGGHTEPSIEEKYGIIYRLIVGNQNHDIEMAREIWEFFKNKRR
jgi:polyhydroxybutyrate depolymerase